MNKEIRKAMNGEEEEEAGSLWRGLFGQFGKPRPRPHSKHGSALDVKPHNLALNLPRLSELRATEIARPKADIVALDENAKLEDFLEALRTHSYSRMPVFRETLDDPIGLVHVKDIFMEHGLDLAQKPFSLAPFIRPIIYAPASMALLTLLQRMQSEHIHMALIIDEYGGVDGLITIEDILEQIVGEITDEHDASDEENWVLEKPGTYLVHARTEISEFTSETGVSFAMGEAAEEVDTIGGLVITLIARVPVKGEVVRLDDGTEFEIVEADPRRVKKLRIRAPGREQSGREV